MTTSVATNVYTDNQLHALELTERIGSIFSLIGTTFIVVTFVTSKAHRKPINRLIFYASLGNIALSIATLISLDGIRAGRDSALCQFQGFLVQMFLPADAFWNLVIAINVYLRIFRNYAPSQLKSLEWIYLLCCYGGTFVPAFIYIFIYKSGKGKVYGPATLWCWIAPEYDWLRVAFVYGPAWFAIITSFAIYITVGKRIFAKRSQLRSFYRKPLGKSTGPMRSYKTTTVDISHHKLANLQSSTSTQPLPKMLEIHGKEIDVPNYEPYSINIERSLLNTGLPNVETSSTRHTQRTDPALKANTAAWVYTKCAMLFFCSLLVTWTPSTVNRIYPLFTNQQPFALTYAGGFVLPLIGFWNAVVYIFTSWKTSKAYCVDHAASFRYTICSWCRFVYSPRLGYGQTV